MAYKRLFLPLTYNLWRRRYYEVLRCHPKTETNERNNEASQDWIHTATARSQQQEVILMIKDKSTDATAQKLSLELEGLKSAERNEDSDYWSFFRRGSFWNQWQTWWYYPFYQIAFLEGAWVIIANSLWSLIDRELEKISGINSQEGWNRRGKGLLAKNWKSNTRGGEGGGGGGHWISFLFSANKIFIHYLVTKVENDETIKNHCYDKVWKQCFSLGDYYAMTTEIRIRIFCSKNLTIVKLHCNGFKCIWSSGCWVMSWLDISLKRVVSNDLLFILNATYSSLWYWKIIWGWDWL